MPPTADELRAAAERARERADRVRAVREAAAAGQRPVKVAPTAPEVEPDETEPDAGRAFVKGAIADAKVETERDLVFGRVDEDLAGDALEARAAELEERRLDTPVSFGGERVPAVMGWLADKGREAAANAREGAGFLYDVGAALAPVSQDTPFQAEERAQAEGRTAVRRATSEDALRARVLELAPDLSPEDLRDALTPASMEDIDPELERLGIDAPVTFGRSDAQARLVERFPTLGAMFDRHNAALTEEQADTRRRNAAAAKESGAAYVMRLMGAPASAVAGVVEAATTDRELRETVPARLRAGEGFTGAGIDVGGAAGRAVGQVVEDTTGLPAADHLERGGKVLGGLTGLGADVLIPLDFGLTDLITGGKAARSALAREAGVPIELAPGRFEAAVRRGVGFEPVSQRELSLAEIRNRIAGIPERHALEARTIQRSTGADIQDAAAFDLARGLSDGADAPGQALVTSIARGLGGETDLVTKAGQAEGRAARARVLAQRAATTERAGTAARNALADLEELRRLEAEDLELAAELRRQGNTSAAERIESRVAESTRVQKAEELAAFKAQNLEKYRAHRADVAEHRRAEADRLLEEAAAARSRADTFQHYARVAEKILAEGPTGAGAKLNELVEGVRALAAPAQQMAPGDGWRALGGAYMQARTWDVVSDVVGRSKDPILASLGAELEIGSQRFLEAVKAKSPELEKAIRAASNLGDTSVVGDLLNERAVVARRLQQYNEITAKAPLVTRQAWARLQSTVGYGTPLIDDLKRARFDWALKAGGKWAWNSAYNALRSGMLSGFLLPNPRFFATNLLTAPAIIYSTLGPRHAVGAVLTWDGIRVLRAIDGGALDQAVVLVRRGEETWTAGDIARIVVENGVSRSQGVEELGSRGIEQLIEFGQRASDGKLKSHLKSLGGYGNNLWAQLANDSDTLFRVNVLTNALRDGRSVEEAVVLARESLFDYGNLSRFERDWLGKVVWFWSFRRNNYRTLILNVLRNPRRLGAIATYNNSMSESIPNGEDTSFLATVGYAENTPMWRILTDPAAGQRFALTGPELPLVSAVEDLANGMALVMLTLEDLVRDGPAQAGARLRDAALGNARPDVAMAASAVFGINLSRGANAEVSGTLDPALVWYLQQTPGMFETAASIFDFRPVPMDRVKSGGNFIPGPIPPGVDAEDWSGQWEIGEDGRTMWAAFMAALAFGGAQRTLRELAPAGALVAETLGRDTVQAPKLGNARAMTALERIGVITGLTPAVNMPAFENTSNRNAAVREREVLP